MVENSIPDTQAWPYNIAHFIPMVKMCPRAINANCLHKTDANRT